MAARSTKRASSVPCGRGRCTAGDECNNALPASDSNASLPSIRRSRASLPPGGPGDTSEGGASRGRVVRAASLSYGSSMPSEFERGGDASALGNSCSSRIVLFLDVDGVLHPSHCRFLRQQFKPCCMQLLRRVIQATGAEIVLSTAWRLDAEARSILSQKLQEHGLPAFVSRTRNIDTFHRSREILAWVQKFRPSSWVAVDDWPLAQETDEMNGHFVQSRPRYGLQPDAAERILKLFREQGVEITDTTL